MHGRRSQVSGPTLPSGAIGVWYADQVVTTAGGRAYVPNVQSASPATPSLWGPTRRLYGNTDFWSQSLVTITDSAAAAQDGTSGDASRYNGTGDSYIQRATILAAGTYTIAAWVKSNTGSSQNFRMRFFTDGLSATKTATTGWQRFTFTGTVAAGARLMTPIASADGVTALDLLFHDIELFAGSADLGVAPASHLYLGTQIGAFVPTYAGGALDFSAGGGAAGYIQFPAATAGSLWTALAIGSKVAAGSSYQAFLSRIQSFGQFSAMFEQATNNEAYLTSGNYVSSYIKHLSTGFHGFAHRYDGTRFNSFVADVKAFDKVSSFSSVSLQDLWVGVVNGTGFLSGYKIAAIALFNRSLSDLEVVQAYAALAAHASSGGVTMADSSTRFVLAEGDSITGASVSYPVVFGPNASPAAIIANNAVGSATLSGNSGNSLDGRKAVNKAFIPASPGSRAFIYTVLIGRNDFLTWSADPAGYAAAVGAHMLEMKQAGFTKTALATVLPSTATNFNAWRNTVNATIKAAGFTTTYSIDAIIDFAADATMGPDAAAANTTYYADGIHPTTAGQAALEPVYRAVVNAL